MLEAFVTNLGKYNEGALVGEYLKLPSTTEDVQALLKRIGIDGVLYEEIFITDYETDIPGLYDCLGEYESIDELNYLAALIDEMDRGDMERFAAAVEQGDHCGSVKELINLTQNLDCYEFYAGIHDDDDLGRYYIEELGAMEVPEYLKNYIDYEAYGRNVSMDECGVYTDSGYVVATGDFTEYYTGHDDIPEEHRIFACPEPEKMSIRDAMSMYQRMTDAAPTKEPLAPSKETER